MSVPSASFQIFGGASYQINVYSCNPQQPVSFMLPGQDYDPGRLQAQRTIGVMGSPQSITITTFPQVAVPTTYNQNPIKLVIGAVSSGEGEWWGRFSVLYGYYLGYGGDGLGFYLNVEQSSNNQPGQVGVPCKIDNSTRSIYLP